MSDDEWESEAKKDSTAPLMRCILTGMYMPDTDDKEDMTWCGKVAYSKMNWCFVDASHAALSGLHGTSIVTCYECVGAIKKALDRTL